MGLFKALARGLGGSRSRVTRAQIDTMLRRTGNALTASRLASAANCTREEALAALKGLAVDGELEYEAGIDELIFHGIAKTR